ncbi:hypothetical protein KY308_02900 [Candidatus Woesearchaeota archaeon]|nr:hypothetical protein [Candidatus Woesearchaeota archaeon]
MIIQIKIEKRHFYFLAVLICAALIIGVSASVNPGQTVGHVAEEVVPGTFGGSGDYGFPDDVNISQNLFFTKFAGVRGIFWSSMDAGDLTPQITYRQMDGLTLSGGKSGVQQKPVNIKGDLQFPLANSKITAPYVGLTVDTPNVTVTRNLTLGGVSRDNWPSVTALDSGYQGVTGTAACASIGKTCSFVMSANYVRVDADCVHAGFLHCVHVCSSYYNTGLQGVTQGRGPNIHSCSAKLGDQVTYLHSGVLQCNAWFTAICV